MRYVKVVSWLLSCLLIFSCGNDSIPEGHITANITGIDFRRCACCGGTMITLSENTEPYAEPFYQWYNSSEELDINAESRFPIPVYIKFKEDTEQCAFSLGVIDVESILRH